ncbi:MAG: DUF2550 domain-containing protein [Nakamurella sp.]
MGLAEIVGLTLLGALVALALIVATRRVVLVRAGGFDVSWRVHPTHGDRGWMLGQARFRRGQLALYRSFSAWPMAAMTLDRTALVLGAVRQPIGAEPDLLPSSVAIVTGTCAGVPLELAMTGDALTALRSWVESRPPNSRFPNREQIDGSVGESPLR